ncbi:MAG: serine/threonine protein kinase, partial [Planctomycetes bacterium]|nr:serine/threonine protein kinase [Planctomycetota bacterium]
MSSLVCPSPAVIRQLACGRVPADRERELDRHLARCIFCRTAHDHHFRPILIAVRELSTSRSGAAHLRSDPDGAIGLVSRPPEQTVAGFGPPPGLRDPERTAAGRGAGAAVTEPDLGTLGKFRLLAILGEGGMGRVYRAEDTSLGREVALKVILLRGGRRAATAGQRRGLFSEAQAAAKLNDPNIVPVYEAGEIDDTPYLVMPLLRGGTLAARLKGAPLSLYELCRIGAQIARGLAAAHGAGLVHRDVKPANVWLEPHPGGDVVRVLDFGLARPLTEVTAGLAGTPAYMAPEQAAGHAVDARADLFSLGVVLFEMVTGKRLTRSVGTNHSTGILRSPRPKSYSLH